MKQLTTITLRQVDGHEVSVTAEATASPHFAIAPEIGIGPDGDQLLTGRLNLCHIPSGTVVVREQSGLDFHAVIPILQRYGDWSSKPDFAPEQVADLRRELFAVVAQQNEEWPWPKWAGDASTPALSLLASQLDEALNGDQRREARRAIASHIADSELARKVESEFAWAAAESTTGTYGVIYLLAVLHRINPEAADRAARDLASAWEAGDSLGEWEYQWREELGHGNPLSLRGFPADELQALIPE